MFYAKTIEGTRISANDYCASMRVMCPGCGASVFFKNGGKKLAHFAHYAHSDCRQFSEGETHLHLLGKQCLFDWAISQKIQVEMEAWLPELKQRPDLLLKIGQRRIALEYQCSPIPFSKLKERTQGYMENGYEVYWICGMDYIPKQYLSERTTAFLQKNGSLICLDSEQNRIYQFQDLQFNQRNQLTWVGHQETLAKLTFSAFESLFQKPIPKRKLAKSAMPYMMDLGLLQRKDPQHRQFLTEIYLAHHALPTLPKFIFSMPTKSVAYRIPAYIWKYAFLSHLKFDAELTFDEIMAFSRNIPAHDTLHPNHDLLFAFVQELEGQGILNRTGNKSWTVRSFSLLNT